MQPLGAVYIILEWLRGRPFDFWGGGGGGWVIWSGREIFFQHLDSQWNFFFRVCACKLFFSPSNILQEFFFLCGWGWKSRHPLMLLATLAAVLFNSNRGSILAFVQFNSIAEQMRSVANVPNNPFVMHSYLTLSGMPFTFTYVPRTITGYTVYIYVNCWIHSYLLKNIYPRLAFL